MPVTFAEIMHLLRAFARHPTKDETIENDVRYLPTEECGKPRQQPRRKDMKAVIDAIATRSEKFAAIEREVELIHDLTHAELRGLLFGDGDLSRINVSGADLRCGAFIGTSLSLVKFAFADLSGAKLADTDLTGSYFYRTNLSGTIFSFEATAMNGDHVEAVVARNLTRSQLDNAVADPCGPPIFGGVIDPNPGEQLEWRGEALRHRSIMVYDTRIIH